MNLLNCDENDLDFVSLDCDSFKAYKVPWNNNRKPAQYRDLTFGIVEKR